MRPFEFHRARDAQALETLSSGPSPTALLAGGQTLVPALRRRAESPARVVDVKPLLATDVMHEVEEAGRVSIGAGATHAALASDPTLTEIAPTLAALAAHVGDPAVRNRGTLGGSLARPHPAGDWPAAALALDATLITDRRTLAFTDLPTAPLGDDGELLTRIRFARPERAVYAKLLHPAERYAMVGVFVARVGDGLRVAVTGVSERGAVRWQAAEREADAGLPSLAPAVSPDVPDARGDALGSAAYRAVLAARLLELARQRLHAAGHGAIVLVHGQPLDERVMPAPS